MATNITSTTQFDVFDTIKSIIKNNSTLKAKFTDKNIFEYEPSKTTWQLPHILINVPSIPQDQRTMGASPIIMKDIEVEIILRVEYVARDKFKTYYNALIAALEADTTLQSSGYIPESVEADSPTVEEEFNKTFVEGVMIFNLNGAVN